MSCDFTGGIMAAMIGTAAGLPLAGIIAAIALSKVTRRIQARLAAPGLVMSIDSGAAQAELDPSSCMQWDTAVNVSNYGIVDDDVFLNVCPASQVVQNGAVMARVLFEEYERAGLARHLKCNKTALVVTWRGPGVKEARQDLAELKGIHGGIPFAANGNARVLPETRKYKHVGSVARGDLKVSTDVVIKAATIRQATGKLKKHVLTNKAIPVATRTSVLHTHAFSTGELSSGGWSSLSKAEAQVWNRTLSDGYRMADGSQRVDPEVAAKICTDLEVAARPDVMAPTHRVSFARIRMMTHILARARTDILVILHAGRRSSRSWLKALEADLTVAAACSSKLVELREASMAQWITFLRNNGPKALVVIKEAFVGLCKTAAADEKASTVVEDAAAVQGGWQCHEMWRRAQVQGYSGIAHGIQAQGATRG